MTERFRDRTRRISMVRVLVVAALLVLGLAGCGDSGNDVRGEDPPASTNSATPSASECDDVQVDSADLMADLDGDGAPDQVHQMPGSDTCPRGLLAVVGVIHDLAPVTDDLPITELGAITLPGHTGDVVLATQTSARGGAQQRMFGYAEENFAEMTTDGKPVFEFIATDAPTEHVSAACTRTGFDVTEAVAHQPVGIVPAWDVYRTSYTVEGNTVKAGPRREIEDNVLDDELAEKYPDVVAGTMFENCRAGVN